MQRYILNKKKQITLIGGILIAIGFLFKFAIKVEQVEVWALIFASVIGAAPIAIQAYQALKVKVISIDLLVTIAVVGAFIIKNYEESAIVTFLFLFGALLEQRTLNKTRSAIKALTEMAPETALRLAPNGEFMQVDIEDVQIGDTLLVKTGAKVPVDGKVIKGQGYVDQASITGESAPVEKQQDAQVFAGTILENGTIQIIAERIGEDTTFGKIIELVEEAQDSKSQTERFIDKFAKYYTPAVLLFSLVVGLISKNIELAITILVLGCPGALVIGVPVSNVAGIGNGAKNGILLKGSEVIHSFSRVDTVVFDKTGTLTIGKPKVVDIKNYSSNQNALSFLASVEKLSDHPLANAVCEYLRDQQLHDVESTSVVKGGGIIAKINGQTVVVGNAMLMQNQNIPLQNSVLSDIEQFENQASSIVLCAIDGKLQLLLAIRDKVRSGVKDDLVKLKKLGVKNLVMLSGDNQAVVNIVAKELGITQAYGNMLPEDKAAYIQKIKQSGKKVAFVGDGVNDSPSIALADIGIAMGGGTDVAIETSDVVLMNSNFNSLPHALGLAKKTARNMRQNIFIAIFVVVMLLIGLFYKQLVNMSIGMLVHEASILAVILNGMRLMQYKFKKKESAK